VVQQKARRFQLAPRRHYSTHIALSNRPRGASINCETWFIATIDRDNDRFAASGELHAEDRLLVIDLPMPGSLGEVAKQ
jgi:hypothetical protein